MDLNFDGENCRKSSIDSISHTCEKSATNCNNPSGFYSATEVSESSLENGYRQCQKGVPGQALQFLFKDGWGCDVKQRDDDVDPPTPILSTSFSTDIGDATLACAPRACCIDTTTQACGTGRRWLNSAANGADCIQGVSSCTGNAPGKECVWTFTIPDGDCESS